MDSLCPKGKKSTFLCVAKAVLCGTQAGPLITSPARFPKGLSGSLHAVKQNVSLFFGPSGFVWAPSLAPVIGVFRKVHLPNPLFPLAHRLSQPIYL